MVSNPDPPSIPKNLSKKSFNRFRHARSRYNKTKKIDDMLKIIENKITPDMKNGFHYIELEYLDINLDFIIDFRKIDNKHINISGFSRRHHVRLHPSHRITHAPAKEGNPASSKGDGALFLALTVLHCNKVLGNISYWKGDLTDWWRIKGVCTIEDACVKTDRSKDDYEINNNFFIIWSLQILDEDHTFNKTVNNLLFGNNSGPSEETKILGGMSNYRKKNRKTLKKIKKKI